MQASFDTIDITAEINAKINAQVAILVNEQVASARREGFEAALRRVGEMIADVLKASPEVAEAQTASPSKRHPYYTPERKERLLAEYRAGTPLSEIYRILSMMDGPPLPTNLVRMAAAACSWGARRPEQTPHYWNDRRNNLIRSEWYAGHPDAKLLEMVNALPGAKVPDSKLVIEHARSTLCLPERDAEQVTHEETDWRTAMDWGVNNRVNVACDEDEALRRVNATRRKKSLPEFVVRVRA